MLARLRPTLSYTPVWEGPIAGWAASHIRKNQWRCDHIHEFDDLLNDAYLLFVKIAERYPRVMEPKNFMGLFKVALRNKLHDHARYVRRKRVAHEQPDLDVSECYADRIGELNHEGPLQALLAEAPEELRLAVTLLSEHPEAVRQNLPEQPENLNAKLRRLLGLTSKLDFTTMLKEMLS